MLSIPFPETAVSDRSSLSIRCSHFKPCMPISVKAGPPRECWVRAVSLYKPHHVYQLQGNMVVSHHTVWIKGNIAPHLQLRDWWRSNSYCLILSAGNASQLLAIGSFSAVGDFEQAHLKQWFRSKDCKAVMQLRCTNPALPFIWVSQW